MSRNCRTIHGCCCFWFNWRTGITTISLITETIQLAISYLCILLLKCLKTHIDNITTTTTRKGKVQQQQIVSPSLSTINELKAFYFIIIIYALVIFIFGIICSILCISGAKKCQPNAILAWLIYQAFFVASSFAITYILIKVRRDEEEYVYKSMEHKTFYDLSTGIYWVTFVTFLPVLLYFWKRVLFFYIEMIKGKIHTAYNVEYNNNFISDMGHSNNNEDDEEGQSVGFIAESFVKNVTLDIEA